MELRGVRRTIAYGGSSTLTAYISHPRSRKADCALVHRSRRRVRKKASGEGIGFECLYVIVIKMDVMRSGEK